MFGLFTKQGGFSQDGVTERGVPRLVGRWNRPPVWYTIGTLLIPLLVVVILLTLLLSTIRVLDRIAYHERFKNADLISVACLLYVGIYCLRYGRWLYRKRREIQRLTPVERVCDQFSVNEERLQSIAEGHQIRPRYNINGQDCYDLTDFGEAARLLRPALPPENPEETLLRPAVTAEAPDESVLLRAADDDRPPTTGPGKREEGREDHSAPNT